MRRTCSFRRTMIIFPFSIHHPLGPACQWGHSSPTGRAPARLASFLFLLPFSAFHFLRVLRRVHPSFSLYSTFLNRVLANCANPNIHPQHTRCLSLPRFSLLPIKLSPLMTHPRTSGYHSPINITGGGRTTDRRYFRDPGADMSSSTSLFQYGIIIIRPRLLPSPHRR